MTPTTLECSGIVDEGQHKRYRSIEAIGDVKVRVVIDLDTSYPRMQSSAHAEMWSPTDLRWNRAAFLTPGEWTDTTYARPGGSGAEDDDILSAHDALMSQIMTILA